MKSKKLFTLLLMGMTALGATTSVHAKEITYKKVCVITSQKPNDCFPTINRPGTDCPEINQPEVDCPEVDQPATDKPGWLPDITVPSEPEVDKPEVDQPATDKPGWLPDISVPSKPEVDKPEINKPEIEKPEVSSQTAYENKVLELVNVERSKQGLKPLQMDESVRNVARVKSSDMRKNNYFDHNSPVYGSPFDMLKQFGISYRSAGENIAQGYSSPEAVVEGWMNSPGHRANILNSSFTHIGVGYDAQGHYWTQMFIGK
ncbi:MAG: CAP domain-containing protein [Niameybacter sp.]